MSTEQLAATAFYEDTIIDPRQLELYEEVVHINRVAKVVKGGRRFSFCALVVVGDRRQHVGVGYGKAKEVPEAIRKAGEQAKRNMVRVPLRGHTIPYLTNGEHCTARVMLRPASPGTGVIAGKGPRAVLELAGVHDILTKCHGSSNIINVVKATFDGLATIKDARHLARLRGKELEELVGAKFAAALTSGPVDDGYEESGGGYERSRTVYSASADSKKKGRGGDKSDNKKDAKASSEEAKPEAKAEAKAEEAKPEAKAEAKSEEAKPEAAEGETKE